MPPGTIDTCCLIDILTSGHGDAILRTSGHAWHLPVAVKGEMQFLRQTDPTDSTKLILVPVDLNPLISSGILTVCQPDIQPELDLFTQYATIFRSDGEAMCMALAESRGWLIATDDRKAIRIGQQAGLAVLSSPQLMKAWAENAASDRATLVKALKDIERLAQFRPNATMPEFQWWMDQLTLP